MGGKGIVGMLVSFAIFVALVFVSLLVLRKMGVKSAAGN